MFAAHHPKPSLARNRKRRAPAPDPRPRCIQWLRLPITGGCARPNLRRRSDTTRASAVRPPPGGTPPPGEVPPGRRSRPARGRASCPTCHRDGKNRPSGLSSWRLHPAPPGRANGAATALPPRRPAPAGSYSPPAPGARPLDHPETSPGTGGTTAGRRAPSQVSVERPSASHVARVQTQGRAVCGGSPRRHRLRLTGWCTGAADFGGPNTEASPYPSARPFRGSASRL